QRIFNCNRSLSKHSHRYFGGCLESRLERYSIVADGALEIDHARTIGGSPPAPLRAVLIPPNRYRDSHRRRLWRAADHRRRGVRHAVGTSFLAFAHIDRVSGADATAVARRGSSSISVISPPMLSTDGGL